MASDPNDLPDGRRGSSRNDPSRDLILPQVTPREGWTSDWRPAIDTLSEMILERYHDANLEALPCRLAPLLTKTVELVALGQPEGKKPATLIRIQIEVLRSHAPDVAVEALRHPHPVLRNYLDAKLEAQDPRIDQPADPDLGSVERAAQRYAIVLAAPEDVLPQPRRGTENPYATVAALVAELLADVTGREPKRTYSHHDTATATAGTDSGWPLAFFRRFVELAMPCAKPPRLDKVWRNALEARKKIKAAIIADGV